MSDENETIDFLITNADTVGLEDQQRQEAQAWIDQRGGLVYVVNLFKDLANEAANTRNFVLRTQQDLVDCQQELVACKQDLVNCQQELAACKQELANCQQELAACKQELANCQLRLADFENSSGLYRSFLINGRYLSRSSKSDSGIVPKSNPLIFSIVIVLFL